MEPLSFPSIIACAWSCPPITALALQSFKATLLWPLMVLMTAERISMPGEATQAKKQRRIEKKIIKTAHQREAALSRRQAITTKNLTQE